MGKSHPNGQIEQQSDVVDLEPQAGPHQHDGFLARQRRQLLDQVEVLVQRQIAVDRQLPIHAPRRDHRLREAIARLLEPGRAGGEPLERREAVFLTP